MENTEIYNEEQELESKIQSAGPTRKQIENDSDRPINWLERVMKLIDKFGFIKIIGTILILFATYIGWNLANAINYEKIAEDIINKDINAHIEASEVRRENNPKVMLALTRMLNELEGDRASVLEMHNGKENPTALPFIYCDMTYEETKGKTPYVSEEYENLNMSKFTFPTYLWKKRYFVGTIEELYVIDKKLAMRLELNDVKYFGIMIVKNEIEIGFIMISYKEIPTQFDPHDIHVKLSDYAQEIGYYLDLNVHTQSKNQ